MGLRIVTFNVHGLPWIQCPMRSILLWAAWQTECEVICFQEVFAKGVCDAIRTYAPQMGYDCYFPTSIPCFAKSWLRFANPSGLCILVKQGIPVLQKGLLHTFEDCAGLDALAAKGVMGVQIRWRGEPVWILNTHFQADFAELPCCSLSYQEIRDRQEQTLVAVAGEWCKRGESVLFCGDYNQEWFELLDFWKLERAASFPSTGQHLDHILHRKHQRTRLQCKKVHFFTEVIFSDHIPVLYEFVAAAAGL